MTSTSELSPQKIRNTLNALAKGQQLLTSYLISRLEAKDPEDQELDFLKAHHSSLEALRRNL